jgi:hypothetical protein
MASYSAWVPSCTAIYSNGRFGTTSFALAGRYWPVSAVFPCGASSQALHLRLLSYFKRIVNCKITIANSALQCRMP